VCKGDAVTGLLDRLRLPLRDERVRFVVVGAVNTAIGYGLFAILHLTTDHLWGYLGSLTISYLIAIAVAFLLHRRLTFRVHGTGDARIDFVRFVGVNLAILAVNVAALALLVQVVGLPPLVGQLIVLVIVTLLSYLGHRYVSFRRRPPAG
jgi:putative flippase GtrA